MKIEIEQSPYGDTGAVYEGLLGMMNHYILQLKSFRTQNKTPEERAHLEADIRGYEEILKSGSQANARKFMEAKQGWIENASMKRFENNEKVIEYLKVTGLWESK